jgi:hypothetical protein
MTAYPEPRRIVLTLPDLRRLTVLERARACAIAGIGEREIRPLLVAVTSRQGEPADLERGVLLLYAIALQLERRLDPALTWEAAQTWDLAVDLDAAPDPVAEAEAHAAVEAALATGLPPAEAGELTLAHLEAYGDVRAEADERAARAPRRRHRRVHR